MVGLKKKVRNVPVSSRTMNEYSAISPSRNDQWSGKIFRKFRLRKFPAPMRSSMKLLVLAMGFGTVPLLMRALRFTDLGLSVAALPETGTGWNGEVRRG
ncbi:hypothetical protein Aros01_09100 [Streptosporangium roseum]